MPLCISVWSLMHPSTHGWIGALGVNSTVPTGGRYACYIANSAVIIISFTSRYLRCRLKFYQCQNIVILLCGLRHLASKYHSNGSCLTADQLFHSAKCYSMPGISLSIRFLVFIYYRSLTAITLRDGPK